MYSLGLVQGAPAPRGVEFQHTENVSAFPLSGISHPHEAELNLLFYQSVTETSGSVTTLLSPSRRTRKTDGKAAQP